MLKREPDRPCGNGRESKKLHRKQPGLQKIARILFFVAAVEFRTEPRSSSKGKSKFCYKREKDAIQC